MTVLSFLLCAQMLSGQDGQVAETTLARLLRENTHRVALTEDELGGPGGAFLTEASANAQFVCMAEPHNVREVPQAFTAIFKTLQRAHGFHYAALETGPGILEAASSPPVRGNREAVIDLYKRFPESFHFYTDQELHAIADIGAASNATTPPIWGVDQVHAVPFIAHHLAELAPTPEQRENAQRLYEVAEAHNRARSLNGDAYIFTVDDNFADLSGWFAEQSTPAIDFLVEQLQLSANVYRNYRTDSEDNPTGYLSNLKREENMKRVFMKRYREAQEAGEALPRVLARLGHWHMMRGQNPGNCYTFGNFLSEFATSNGMTSFHIGVSVINEPGKYWSMTESEGLASLAAAGSSTEWRIIDLRPLRAYAHAGALDGLTREVRDWIFHYDAALLLGGADRGTYTIDIERKRELRRRERAQ